MIIKSRNHRTLVILLLAIVLLSGIAKFWHYNYVEHTENARNLRLPGLLEFVCKGTPYDETKEACGRRSVWGESDWGVTAYITVYGIESKAEAEEIATFLIQRRKQSGQDGVPINFRAYSAPRSQGRERSEFKILEKKL